MPALRLVLSPEVPQPVRDGLARLEAELEVPQEFPADVLAAAEQAAAEVVLPALDLTAIEFVTVDPPSSLDLDQALCIVADGSGFLVHYAIADVAAFVTPGGPIDRDVHRRGQTLYEPHRRIGLHPPRISEDAGSLLADQIRPALVWSLSLDAAGQLTHTELRRARIRSRAKLSYQQVQDDLDAGRAPEGVRLLATVGPLREKLEIERGGVSLALPEQEVVADGDTWRLEFRQALPVEGWNAQISLLTGMAAAQLMVAGQVGVLRTLPPAEDGALRRLRTTARALGLDWPTEVAYPEFVRGLDPSRGREAAMLNACTALFRGAGYLAFSGSVPEQRSHAALAAEYAHTTAPLRRLVDRYVGEICLALSAGQPVPGWVLDALETLPEEMQRSDSRAKKFERGVVDLTEALVLSGREGQVFTGTVVDVDAERGRGRVVIADPAVEVSVKADQLPLGDPIQVRLVSVDLAQGQTVFERV